MLDGEGVTSVIKVGGSQRFGARVVLHGRSFDEAAAEALRIRDAAGARLIQAPAADGSRVAGE